MLRFLPCLFLLASLSPSLAELTVGALFGNGAVLQRDKPVPVWGTAAPGEKVTVSFDQQQKEATAESSGRWQVTLDPLPASMESRVLSVRGAAEAVRSRDVLVGDVWLCSGQSNMTFRVSRAMNGDAEAAAASAPEIRCLNIPMIPSANPSNALRAKWELGTPQKVSSFSAVAYFFAREIHRELKIPVGLITSSWGGTQIESWIRSETLQQDPAYGKILARWQERLAAIPEERRRHAIRVERQRVAMEKAKADGVEFKVERPLREPDGEVSRFTPSGLYNGMINPIVPVALRGMIWYQGESNSGRPLEYQSLFPSLIRQWRDSFGQGDIPFYFVQIANWKRAGDDIAVAYLREAQTAALKLPHTGMAVAIDIGDPDNVHPKNKQEVGRRLALVALAETYGKGGSFSGPMLREAKFAADQVRVKFDHGESLTLKEGLPNGFELAGEDRQFHPATVTLDKDTAVLSSPSVPKPVAARYAFHNDPPSTLFNAAGLPAAPFRTDDWPYVPPVDLQEKDLP